MRILTTHVLGWRESRVAFPPPPPAPPPALSLGPNFKPPQSEGQSCKSVGKKKKEMTRLPERQEPIQFCSRVHKNLFPTGNKVTAMKKKGKRPPNKKKRMQTVGHFSNS